MKKMLITSWLVFLALLANSQWTWRNPVPQGYDLHVSVIKNGTSVWAGSDLGNIIHSEDGGLTWDCKNLARYTKFIEFVGLDWPDDSVGFATDKYGYIFKTLDEGITWDSMYWEPEVYLNASSFIDAQHGFVVGSEGKIIRTTDGGVTWTPYYFNIPVNLTCVSFTSSLTGYAAGDLGRILKTTDGGNTWDAVYNDSVTEYRGMVFPTTNMGFVVGTNGIVMKTTDAGASWTKKSLNDTAWFSSIAAFSPDTLIVNGIAEDTVYSYDAPVKYLSTDGGNTWTQLQLPYYETPFTLNITAQTGGTAYATGYWGCIEKTTDYGASWTSLTKWVVSPVSWGARIYGINFPTSQIGYAVIDGGEISEGRIIKTIDGGDTWFLLDSSSQFPGFRAVDFVNENMGFIGGRNIYSTFDGGQTWILRMSDLGWQGIRSISHTDNGICVAVGYNGVMVRSTDYGQSWQYVPGVPDLEYSSVCFADESTGFTVGNSTLLKTTDAGATWNVISEEYPLLAIDFPTPDKGFAVGILGLIMRTTDGGETWEQYNYPTSDYLNAVNFYDADTGYAVGGTDIATALVLKTTDGGVSWHEQFIPVDYPLHAIAVTGDRAFTGSWWCYLFGTNNGGIQVSTGPRRDSPTLNSVIFPNPTAQKLTILNKKGFSKETIITIYTVTGNSVLSEEVKDKNRVELDISALAPDTYFVKIQSTEATEVKKLVIQ